MKNYRMFIDGQWVDSASGDVFAVCNPADGSVIAYVARGGKPDIDKAVAAARRAFTSREWGDAPPSARAGWLMQIARLLRERKRELAETESLDNGKPLIQAEVDVEVAARYCEYYAGAADKIYGESIPLQADYVDFTIREPLGVSAHIVPWNYPLQICVRGVAPAVAAGNTVVVKPAEDTPLTALLFAEICSSAGLPDGVVNVVTGYGREAGAALAEHPDINQLTFTGSVATGVSVMRAAAANVVPVTLELGGKSPNIVFADADMEEAENWVAKSILQNAGQTCSAGARLIIERSVKERFVARLADRFSKLRLGPGLSNPDIGPLINRTQFDRVVQYMAVAKEEGLRIVAGGEPAVQGELSDGAFFKPTIIDDVPANSRLCQEEIFGPVLCVQPFDDFQQAIDLANATAYGLVAGIWTSDINKALRAAKLIRAGQVYINAYGAGGGVELPFGGYGKSGFGREKGLEALRQYTQVKNVAARILGW